MPGNQFQFPKLGEYDPATCPQGPHRGPQGPNEDISQCYWCGSPDHVLRRWGETYGTHAADCSLPIWHEGFCAPGGSGHPRAPEVRGYFPSGGEESPSRSEEDDVA